ncbi:hypothetical protein [Paraburkholderia sp. C35]|uniref:hypothetical protein n=1 Tax=Paraburkholderia sp. C35 TaxID=2126993 RepID=UPI001EF652DC|nr:hypothetical protein [Paraburkholderia sp. C35]
MKEPHVPLNVGKYGGSIKVRTWRFKAFASRKQIGATLDSIANVLRDLRDGFRINHRPNVCESICSGTYAKRTYTLNKT